MAKRCELCGKGPATGNTVSHSKRHTKRRFLPNVFKKKILDPIFQLPIIVKICTRCIRTMAKKTRESAAVA